jgi:serine/threonine protein kinase
MRPNTDRVKADLKSRMREVRHSRSILSFLHTNGFVEGIQHPGRQIVELSQFVTETGSDETLKQPQEGELLPYYDKGDLCDSLESLTREQRVSVVNQLLIGSYHMMLQGISHGDIKPSNMFLKGNSENSSTLQICHGDWGGAKVFN